MFAKLSAELAPVSLFKSLFTHTILLQYIVPVLVMAYCYAMMALTIWRNKDLNNAEVSILKLRDVGGGMMERMLMF